MHLPTAPLPTAPGRLSALALALTLPVATGCSALGADDGTTVLRVGELGAVPATQELFEAAGVDEDLPYELDWQQFVNAGPEYVEAAGADAVDVGTTADTPLIFAEEAGAGLTAVAVISAEEPEEESDNAILVRGDSGIGSVSDLEGARVSFQEGTVTQYHVIRALEEEGLTLEDVDPVDLPVTDGVTALENGDVDAVATVSNHWAQAEAQGARTLATGAGTIAGNSLISAREEALADEDLRPAIEDYVRRHAEAVEWKEENPQEWAQIYADLSGLPVEVAEEMEDKARTSVGPITAEALEAQQDQSDAYLEVGVLSGRQDVTGQFDPRFNGLFDAPTTLEELAAG